MEEKINELEKKIDANMEKIISNMNHLHSCEEQINKNSKKIQKNTSALELLHTINNVKKRFFIMWSVTFIALLISIGYNIYLLNDINTVTTTTTQEIEQDNENGTNNFIGRDGDING